MKYPLFTLVAFIVFLIGLVAYFSQEAKGSDYYVRYDIDKTKPYIINYPAHIPGQSVPWHDDSFQEDNKQ